MRFSEARDRFLEEMALFKSANTVSTYKVALSRFGAGLGSDLDLHLLTCNNVLEFARWLREKDCKQSTVSTYLAGVGAFYQWLLMEGLVPFTMEDHLRLNKRLANLRRPPPDKLPKLPDEDALQSILDYIRNHPDGRSETSHTRLLRDRALTEALRCTGCRISELVGLSLGDLVPSHKAATVIGKGGKGRLVFFDKVAWDSLMAYLAHRGDTHCCPRCSGHLELEGGSIACPSCKLAWDEISDVTLRENQPVFMCHYNQSHRGRRMTSRAVRDMFYRLALHAGVRRINPHAMRHRFGTLALEQTKDLAAVQDLLGHASPVTTRIYAKLSGTQKKNAFDSLSL